MVSLVGIKREGQSSFSGRDELVHPDMVNFYLKTNDGRDRRPKNDF